MEGAWFLLYQTPSEVSYITKVPLLGKSVIQGKLLHLNLWGESPRSISASLSISPYLFTALMEIAHGHDLPQLWGRSSSISAPTSNRLPLPHTSCWSLWSTSSWWRALIPTRSRLHRFRSKAMKGSFPLSVEGQAQGKESKGWVRGVRDQSKPFRGHIENSGWREWGTNIWSTLLKMF